MFHHPLPLFSLLKYPEWETFPVAPMMGVQTLDFSFICCMALGNLLNIWALSFLICKMGMMQTISTSPDWCGEDSADSTGMAQSKLNVGCYYSWCSPGGGNGNPLQYSCLGEPIDRGAWWATVHGICKSRKRLSAHTHTFLMLKLSLSSVRQSRIESRRQSLRWSRKE